MTSNIESYSKDELEAPKWLNDQFITEVLSKHEKAQNVKVLEIKLSPASVQGDHYASIMFRMKVDYCIGNKNYFKSLIIKTMPEEDGHKKEFLGDSKIFQTEIAMYTQVLPKFEKILRAAGEETILCASCIYHSLEPRQVMIFEDLLPLGYQVVRKRPANKEELQAALAKLAKWHAVSHKLLKEEPEMFDELQYDLTTLPNFVEEKMITEALPAFTEMLGHSETLKKYQKYFEALNGKLIQRWVNIIREYRENHQEHTYYVLCHGDFHLRNMMFKRNKTSGSLEDCKLLDFQMSYVGSATNDVIYAIYMLFGQEVRRDQRDELIYYYFKIFTDTLEKIGFKGKMPSLVEYRQQMFQKKDNELFLITAFLPAMITLNKESLDIGSIIEDEQRRNKLYYDQQFQEELEHLLPRMEHLGYFEQD